MLIPIIKVFDKGTGAEHIVGTNSHDALLVDKRKITYLNLHNCCGTEFDEEYGYDFVVGDYDPEVDIEDPHIEMVTLEQFIEMNIESITEATRNKIELYRMIHKKNMKELDKAREETGIQWDSAGEILE